MEKADDSRNRVGRAFRRLIAVHLVLGMAPVLIAWVPPDVRFLPVIWMLFSVLLGQLMLLGFWAGMGTSRVPVRILGPLLGIGYVAIWPLASSALSRHSTATSGETWMSEYVVSFCAYAGLVLLIAAIFLLLRRSLWELRRTDGLGETVTHARFQYSILHLLVIASLGAVGLGLTRAARPDSNGSLPEWGAVAALALVLVVLPVNSVCAAKAALGTGRVGLPIALVLLVAALSGVALPLSSHHDRIAWWLIPTGTLTIVIPTGLAVASLLLVRRCGYRLVPKE